jgi:hypothetical protein
LTAIREGNILLPICDTDVHSVFHILDSLQDDVAMVARREGKRLQNILLKHFEGATFMEGRLNTNMAEVYKFLYLLSQLY